MDRSDLRKELIRRMSNEDELLERVRQAVNEAVLDHKRAGNPIAVKSHKMVNGR
jgi:hypothetical protein